MSQRYSKNLGASLGGWYLNLALPQHDTVLSGPFWSGPVRVLRAAVSGPSVRIEAVGLADNQYYDRTDGIASPERIQE